MSLALKDPRQFSTLGPESNILLSQAAHDLAQKENNHLLVALLEDFLKAGQDGLISVAYNLAPTQQIADYIWAALQEALAPAQGYLFAIPLVLVVGSSSQLTLPQAVDQQQLQRLFVDKQLFLAADQALISGQLFDLDGIVGTKLSTLYTLTQQATSVAEFDFDHFSSAQLSNLGENVHLRFLIGMANCSDDLVLANFSKLGLELLQVLSNGLQTPGATIFPLPFPPCSLAQAASAGQHARNEIAITLRLSNLVKKMRLERKVPSVRLASSDGQILIHVCDQAGTILETLTWPLLRSDNFSLVCQILEDLFTDMQLELSYEPDQN